MASMEMKAAKPPWEELKFVPTFASNLRSNIGLITSPGEANVCINVSLKLEVKPTNLLHTHLLVIRPRLLLPHHSFTVKLPPHTHNRYYGREKGGKRKQKRGRRDREWRRECKGEGRCAGRATIAARHRTLPPKIPSPRSTSIRVEEKRKSDEQEEGGNALLLLILVGDIARSGGVFAAAVVNKQGGRARPWRFYRRQREKEVREPVNRMREGRGAVFFPCRRHQNRDRFTGRTSWSLVPVILSTKAIAPFPSFLCHY
ncbi:uncharacterized protein [Arachis hypogaea]|uniref:uncharacterized protein n=1 Tax=Arachis hypogaea TaxID=3818 RepID=UPI003B20BF47